MPGREREMCRVADLQPETTDTMLGGGVEGGSVMKGSERPARYQTEGQTYMMR